MKSITYAIILMMLAGSLVRAQQVTQKELRPLFNDAKSTTPAAQSFPLETAPLDAPLDVKTYTVGAGDIFQVSISSMSVPSMQSVVSSEGLLIIPTVRAIPVKGLSLAKAKDLVVENIRKVYVGGSIEVALVQPRTVLIRLSGTGVIPGLYEFSASDRVSTVILQRELRKPIVPAKDIQQRADVALVPIAMRSLLLLKADGTRLYPDIERYRITGDDQWNPHVAEGDELIVVQFDDRIPSMAIGGAVWVPGEYEYRSGDRLIDLVRIARGPLPSARTDSVMLQSLNRTTEVLDLSGPDSSHLLDPGDRVWILTSADESRARTVLVSGEVLLPGSYPIVEGSTRLSDVIHMAGGLTKNALLSAATLQRREVSADRRDMEWAISFRGNNAIEDTGYVRLETGLRMLGERVDVEFEEALNASGTSADPFVFAGDNIHVPRKTGTVYVFGQVARPGHIQFVPGRTAEEYIKEAGGMTDRAKTGDVVVIKSSTRQWLDPGDTEINESDAVFVPQQIEGGTITEYTKYGQLGSVVSAVATVILVIVQITR